jgi:hypothetical protein
VIVYQDRLGKNIGKALKSFPTGLCNVQGNGQLYNGLVAPLVNTTVAGWLWYQGENSLCYDAGIYG